VTDAADLERFVRAQDPVWTTVTAELRRGRKTSHWIWFVFPQVADLGLSDMSRRYAIDSLAEARRYLAHPVLGPRLREATGLLLQHGGRDATDVLGDIDARKVRSSMTLFGRAAPDERSFGEVLARWYDGAEDARTLELLGLA
jgi:uncharacterized protein (DUF1810 family)